MLQGHERIALTLQGRDPLLWGSAESSQARSGTSPHALGYALLHPFKTYKGQSSYLNVHSTTLPVPALYDACAAPHVPSVLHLKLGSTHCRSRCLRCMLHKRTRIGSSAACAARHHMQEHV